jgi:hypothetical protein
VLAAAITCQLFLDKVIAEAEHVHVLPTWCWLAAVGRNDLGQAPGGWLRSDSSLGAQQGLLRADRLSLLRLLLACTDAQPPIIVYISNAFTMVIHDHKAEDIPLLLLRCCCSMLLGVSRAGAGGQTRRAEHGVEVVIL